jgi:hypothetical protein
MAKKAVVRVVAADLERVRGSTHTLTARQWAARWNGLLRPGRHTMAGFSILSGW